MNAVELVFDRESFRQWLAAKDPDEVVGSPADDGDCPLARFAQERTGTPWSITLGEGARPRDRLELEPLPEWAGWLLRVIDLSAAERLLQVIAAPPSDVDALVLEPLPELTAKRVLTYVDSLELLQ